MQSWLTSGQFGYKMTFYI